MILIHTLVIGLRPASVGHMRVSKPLLIVISAYLHISQSGLHYCQGYRLLIFCGGEIGPSHTHILVPTHLFVFVLRFEKDMFLHSDYTT